jgi:hypothetical protein
MTSQISQQYNYYPYEDAHKVVVRFRCALLYGFHFHRQHTALLYSHVEARKEVKATKPPKMMKSTAKDALQGLVRSIGYELEHRELLNTPAASLQSSTAL